MSVSCPVIRLDASGGEIEVWACTPRLLRLRFFGPPVVTQASYVGREEWPPVPAVETGSDPAAGQTIATGLLTVHVDDSSGSPQVGVYDGGGRRLFGTTSVGGIVREEVVDPVTGARRGRVAL